MDTGRAPRLGYRPSLDGIRGLSVLAVLAFHAQLPFSSGGFLGVAVFFALSGFLITYLLCIEIQNRGGVSLRHFYLRRVLRLLPAFLLLASALMLYAWWQLEAPERIDYFHQVVAAMLYVTNWLIAFDVWPQLEVLSHTWSLSIEEQFYSIWPACLILILGRGRRPSRLLGWIALGFVASTLTRAYLFASHETHARAYYGSGSNAGILLAGCAIGVFVAYGHVPRSPLALRVLRSTSWLAAAGITAACMFAIVDAPYMYYGGFALFAVASAVLILGVVVEPAGRLSRLLAFGPLVAVGKISYALYLWHLPVYLLVRIHFGHQSHGVIHLIEIGSTFALAISSYFLVEIHFLKLKPDRVPAAASP